LKWRYFSGGTVEFEQIKMMEILSRGNYRRNRYKFMASFLADKINSTPDCNVLDIGSCDGSLHRYLPTCHYTEIDLPSTLDEGFIDFNDDKIFDVVVCTGVLEHLLYPLAILIEVKRILKDDGLALFSLPNDHSFSYIYSRLMDPLYYDDHVHGHHWGFTISSAREFVSKEFTVKHELPHLGVVLEELPPIIKGVLGQCPAFVNEWFMLAEKKVSDD